jgi:hypothetical protein
MLYAPLQLAGLGNKILESTRLETLMESRGSCSLAAWATLEMVGEILAILVAVSGLFHDPLRGPTQNTLPFLGTTL